MTRRIFERQLSHALALAILLAGAWWVTRDPRVAAGELEGHPTRFWYALAVAVPVAHQLYVWLAWRLELHLRLLTRTLGRAAFPLYAAGFAVLFLGRFVTLISVSLSNRGSIAGLETPLRGLAVLLAIPALYTFYSVARYFGILRAFGTDHFDPAAARRRPLVRRGMFRATPNAMYVFGLLAGWLPGLYWSSAAGLVAAAFSHAYIWVHYTCVELPDMRVIYSTRPSRPAGDATG